MDSCSLKVVVKTELNSVNRVKVLFKNADNKACLVDFCDIKENKELGKKDVFKDVFNE